MFSSKINDFKIKQKLKTAFNRRVFSGQKRKSTMPIREAQTQPTLQLTSVRRGAKQSKLSTRCMR